MANDRVQTVTIHSKRLRDFLVELGFEEVEVVDNPFKENFKSWKFEKTQEIKDAMNLYSSESIEFKELCEFIQEKAQEGVLYFLVDLAEGIKSSKVEYKINHKKHIVYRIRKSDAK